MAASPDFHSKQDVQNLLDTKTKPLNTQSIHFYDQFCKIYLSNKILVAQVEQLEVERQRLMKICNKIDKKDDTTQQNQNHSELQHQSRKRVRRTAVQIQRHYNCKVPNCLKSYGSEGSLNQHMRFKHPEIDHLQQNPEAQQSMQIKKEQIFNGQQR